ncbi:hypothetical protein OGV91_22910 [Citrobacter sp. Cf093]|uniref:hypothetical protein n=1 Tax=Citrobacter sp. Cf093 TaxID=2985056 RepID=UPI002574972B|nr:hypothetical protein [Citrobacter sp. Cf093]MDM3214819.1 hypothetical protein [Citrobacter sp. Cf093]
MTVYEMEGFLRGKCLPGDMKVNESNAQYLVRKFSEFESNLSESKREFRAADATIHNLELKLTDLAVQLANAESKCRELAANAIKQEFIKTCFRAAADGASMDGDDIQRLGERLGLFGRETYQPVLHGYICGHEAGEDTVYVMKKTPATDAFLAEVRAQGVEMFADDLLCPDLDSTIREFADQLRKGAAL